MRWRLIYASLDAVCDANTRVSEIGRAGCACQPLKHTRNLILWSKLFLVCRSSDVHTCVKVISHPNGYSNRMRVMATKHIQSWNKKPSLMAQRTFENMDADCMGKTESMSIASVFRWLLFSTFRWKRVRHILKSERQCYFGRSCFSSILSDDAVICYDIWLPFCASIEWWRQPWNLYRSNDKKNEWNICTWKP